MSTSSSPRKALVIGGSIGGLFAANLLARNGWTVTILERTQSELADRGTGIVTHRELFEALELAGVDIRQSLGITVAKRITYDRQGAVVSEQPYEQIVTAWSRLHRALKDVFPHTYLSGKTLARIEDHGDRVMAFMNDGEAISGDILIGADGIHSTVRQQLWPDSVPQYAGYVGWRGLISEQLLSDESRQALMPYFAFCLPPHEQMLGYPVAGPNNTLQEGQLRYNFVWYRPTTLEQLRLLQTDKQGVCHPHGIAPSDIRPELLDDVRSTANRLLSPPFAEAVRHAQPLFFQPIYDLVSEKMAVGRVALLGDAASVARPHCGMGVTKAAYDAITLVNELEQAGPHIEAGLASYATKRLAFAKAIVQHARNLGSYLQPGPLTDHERKMAQYYQDPKAVMEKTAISLDYLDLDADRP